MCQNTHLGNIHSKNSGNAKWAWFRPNIVAPHTLMYCDFKYTLVDMNDGIHVFTSCIVQNVPWHHTARFYVQKANANEISLILLASIFAHLIIRSGWLALLCHHVMIFWPSYANLRRGSKVLSDKCMKTPNFEFNVKHCSVYMLLHSTSSYSNFCNCCHDNTRCKLDTNSENIYC